MCYQGNSVLFRYLYFKKYSAPIRLEKVE